MKTSILVLTFTPIKSEPRALKQINRLKQDYNVTTAGFGPPPVEGVPHIELEASPPVKGILKIPGIYSLALVLRLYSFLSKSIPRSSAAFKKLSDRNWDIIIAHDVLTMPLANRLQPRLGVLCDLHEYAPRQNEHSLKWRLAIAPYFRWILRKHVTNAAEVTTVGQGIVDEYKKQFGIDASLSVNATPFQDLETTKTTTPIRLVHSGIPAPARKLELMIEGVMKSSANVTLDLYLMPTDDAYLQKLKNMAINDSRIRFKPPVAYEELIATLHRYDIGISLIAPTTFNLAWCLPNKFFDFIQARLGVIVGPSPEMQTIVEKYGIGSVTQDFTSEAFAQTLNQLTVEKVDSWKQRSHESASALSGEQQVEVWVEAVRRIENLA